MSQIRRPAVAGTFYPADPQELRQQIRTCLDSAVSAGVRHPKALIVPHAGYIYSGPVAASVYKSLTEVHEQIHTVVLIGPSHRVAFRGLAVPGADYFATPLGQIPIDRAGIDAINSFDCVQTRDDAHQLEHSLEVQLPFLQEVLDAFTLIPIVAGDAEPTDVGEVLNRVWGGAETLIVVSSDLSHFLDYESAQRIDRETSNAIIRLEPENLSYESACGRIPVKGLLHLAKKLGLEAELVDLRNSGDTAGSKDRVVGYGAYIFH